MQHTKDNSNKKKSISWLFAEQKNTALHFDIKRYLIPAVIAYGCGICLILSRYRAAAHDLSLYLFWLALAHFTVLTALSIAAKRRSFMLPAILQVKWRILPLVLLTVFLLGMCRAHYAVEIQHKVLKDAAGSTVWVRGTVETIPKLTDSGYYVGFVLEPYYMENANEETLEPLSGKIRVYLPAKYNDILHRNDAIEGYLELAKPTGASFSGGFDYAMYLNQNNIPVTAVGKSFTPATEIPERSLFQKYRDFGLRINQSIGQSVARHFSYNEDCAAIMTGILIGDKSGFSDELYEDFSESGLMHIAAVSGLHISFLIAALTFLMTRFRLPKSMIHLILIPILLLFMSAASFTPSVCRAVIMAILFLLSYTIQKDPDQKTALFAAAGTILTFNPYLLFNAGFILSFGAVLAIQLFNPLLERKFRAFGQALTACIKHSALKRGVTKITEYLSAALSVSVASFLGTVYFIAYFFHLFSPSGIFAGLWVIPCVSLLFVGGYAIWLFDFITPWLGDILRCFLALPLEIVKATAKLLSDSPLVKTVPSPSASMFFFYLTFLFLLHFYLKYSDRFDRETDTEHEISA